MGFVLMAMNIGKLAKKLGFSISKKDQFGKSNDFYELVFF